MKKILLLISTLMLITSCSLTNPFSEIEKGISSIKEEKFMFSCSFKQAWKTDNKCFLLDEVYVDHYGIFDQNEFNQYAKYCNYISNELESCGLVNAELISFSLEKKESSNNIIAGCKKYINNNRYKIYWYLNTSVETDLDKLKISCESDPLQIFITKN